MVYFNDVSALPSPGHQQGPRKNEINTRPVETDNGSKSPFFELWNFMPKDNRDGGKSWKNAARRLIATDQNTLKSLVEGAEHPAHLIYKGLTRNKQDLIDCLVTDHQSRDPGSRWSFVYINTDTETIRKGGQRCTITLSMKIIIMRVLNPTGNPLQQPTGFTLQQAIRDPLQNHSRSGQLDATITSRPLQSPFNASVGQSASGEIGRQEPAGLSEGNGVSNSNGAVQRPLQMQTQGQRHFQSTPGQGNHGMAQSGRVQAPQPGGEQGPRQGPPRPVQTHPSATAQEEETDFSEEDSLFFDDSSSSSESSADSVPRGSLHRKNTSARGYDDKRYRSHYRKQSKQGYHGQGGYTSGKVDILPASSSHRSRPSYRRRDAAGKSHSSVQVHDSRHDPEVSGLNDLRLSANETSWRLKNVEDKLDRLNLHSATLDSRDYPERRIAAFHGSEQEIPMIRRWMYHEPPHRLYPRSSYMPPEMGPGYSIYDRYY